MYVIFKSFTLRKESPSIFLDKSGRGRNILDPSAYGFGNAPVMGMIGDDLSNLHVQKSSGSRLRKEPLPTSSTIHIEHAPNSKFSATSIQPLPWHPLRLSANVNVSGNVTVRFHPSVAVFPLELEAL